MAANAYAVLSAEVDQVARLLVDSWLEAHPEALPEPGTWADHALLELRGMVAQLCSDVRTAGYLEGVQRGRRETAHVVLDALRGEGLAP